MQWPFFEYYVFASAKEDPTEAERASGVYLRTVAEAQYLQRFFDPLCETHGIGICTSDDEIITGAALNPLADAVARAISEVEAKPATWPVKVGYTSESMQEPIIKHASRESLLRFLAVVAGHIEHALRIGGHVHFGGGG